jgi:hypothetical protein
MTSRTNRQCTGGNRKGKTRLPPAALQRRRQEALKRYLAGDPIEAIWRRELPGETDLNSLQTTLDNG